MDLNLVLSHVVTGLASWIGHPISATTSSPIAYRSCTRIADSQTVGWVTGLTGPAAAALPSAAVLVAQARASLVLDLPDVATSPPRGGIQLVAVPVWFWIENFNATAVTATIPGLSATLTATPTTTTYRISDGAALTCQGAGTRYDRTRPSADQHSDCTHPFDVNGAHTVEATVTWSLSWSATNGQTGVLPAVSRTTTFDLTIEQAQAVTR